MTPQEKLLRAVFAQGAILKDPGGSEPVEVKRDEVGVVLSQHIETGEPRRPDDSDIVVLTRDQMKQLVELFQAILREAH